MYVIIISALLAPLFYTKKLKELTVISIILVVGFSLFLGAFVFQLIIIGTSQNPDFVDNHNENENAKDEYFTFDIGMHAIACFSVVNSALLF